MTGERHVVWLMVLAGSVFPLGKEVLGHWMPIYLAGGIACWVCFATAGVYVNRGPGRTTRGLIGGVRGGVFAAVVYYYWP